MRKMVFGIFLGIWITLIIALIERYKMSDYLWVAFIIVSAILIFVGMWQLILKFISKVSPELWYWINKISAPAVYDEAMEKRLEERKAKREKRRKRGE